MQVKNCRTRYSPDIRDGRKTGLFLYKYQLHFDLCPTACYYELGIKSAANSLSDSGEDNT